MARRPPTEVPSRGARAMANRDRLSAMSTVAGRLKDWRPQAEVIRNVEAVPTIFPQYDDATGVGGHPISRFSLIHGPSNEGKTEFLLGLGYSFLRAGHFFGLADAERTTTADWVRSLMGGIADHPGFQALPIKTYEQVRDSVRHYCETIANARVKGELPPDTTGLIGIDSIRKLVPKKLWEELSKAQAADKEDAKKGGRRGGSKGHVDGFGGRAGQMKAALNAAWVDELVPLLADTRMAMVVIARETKDAEADMFSGSKDWKIGGGSALFYEASLDIRITRGWSKDGDGQILGERHRLEIWKTKVAHKQVKVPTAFFHTSNGTNTPAGFEMGRDLVELGLDLDVLSLSGSWIRWGDDNIGQGLDRTVVKLHSDPELLARLDKAVRDASNGRKRT